MKFEIFCVDLLFGSGIVNLKYVQSKCAVRASLAPPIECVLSFNRPLLRLFILISATKFKGTHTVLSVGWHTSDLIVIIVKHVIDTQCGNILYKVAVTPHIWLFTLGSEEPRGLRFLALYWIHFFCITLNGDWWIYMFNKTRLFFNAEEDNNKIGVYHRKIGIIIALSIY